MRDIATSFPSCPPDPTGPNPLPEAGVTFTGPGDRRSIPPRFWRAGVCGPRAAIFPANEPRPHQGRPLLPDSEGRADKWTSAAACGGLGSIPTAPAAPARLIAGRRGLTAHPRLPGGLSQGLSRAGPVPGAGVTPWPEPSQGTTREPVGNPPADHRITESQNSRGWKGPLWVIYSNPPAEAGSPTAGCTGPCPGRS